MQHKNIAPQDSHSPSQEQVENNTGSDIQPLRCITYVGVGTLYPDAQVADPGDDVRGLSQSVIQDGSRGYILVYGMMYNVDTSAWAPGTSLYCGVGGALTNVSSGPQVGNVLKQHATTGVIQVTCLDTPGALVASLQDTDSIDMDTVGLNIKSDLVLSPAAATSGFLKATTTIKTGGQKGLHIEYPYTSLTTDGVFASSDYKLLSVDNVIVVQKNPGTGQFSSIKDAVDSITDASSVNPYLVVVGPGVYTEDTITLQSFVTLAASGNGTAIIQPSDVDNDIVHIVGSSCRLQGFLLQGATGTAAAVRVTSAPVASVLDFITINNCTEGIVLESTATAIQVVARNIRIISGSTTKKLIRVSANGAAAIIRVYSAILTDDVGTAFEDAIFVTGAGARIDANTMLVRSTVGVGYGIRGEDGAEIVSQVGSEFEGFDVNFGVPNVGAASLVRTNTLMLRQGGTADIDIQHPGTYGSMMAKCNTDTMVFVDDAAPIKLILTDPRNASSTGIFIKGDILQADVFDRRANLSLVARKATTLGVIEDVQTAWITTTSGLSVDIAEGVGFLNDPTDVYLKEISWPDTNLVLPADSTNYIFVDTNGVVMADPALPSLETVIVLGRVNTNSTDVRFIENSDMPMNHYGNKTERFLRDVIGPIFHFGCIITESASPRQLDNTGGVYHYGVSELHVDAGVAIEWESFYRDGVGGFTSLGLEDTLSNTLYDDGTGTLASIPAGEYARHHLYVLGDTGNEKWFLVYAQDTYPSSAAALEAPLPTIPSFMSDAIARVAGIVVQEGVANIIDPVLDLRPRIGFAAPTGTSVTDHGALTGLLDNDHPQYLRRSGVSAMTGNLDMGGQNIVNVNLVDGVDVSTHEARHRPGGSDAMPTAAPSVAVGGNTSNAEGTSTSLSRADHQHAVATGTPSSQTPDQANAAGTSNDLARADHIHNIATAAPATANADGSNNQGVSTSFSRADHKHNVAVGTPVSQTPDQANAAGSSSSLARADHIHNIPAGAPATTLSPATSNAEGTTAEFARADHTHAVATGLVGDISVIEPDDAAAAGTVDRFARADHQHAIAAAAPSTNITTSGSNTEGVSNSFARADHSHKVDLAYTQVSSEVDFSTNSATPVTVTTMTVTPAAGTYKVEYSGVSYNSNGITNMHHGIYVNGTVVGHSTRTLIQGGGNQFANTRLSIHTQAVITANGTDVIDIRVSTSAGTMTVQHRSLTLIRLT